MIKKVYFSRKVDDDSIAWLIDQCKDEKEIYLYLNSTGGNPFSAIAFYNFIKFNKIKLTVNVLSDCFSSALIILLAGKKRLAATNSHFLLHMLKRTYESQTTLKVAELKKEAEDLQNDENRLQKLIAKALKKKLKELIPIFEAEKTLTAKEAFELGLLTEKPY